MRAARLYSYGILASFGLLALLSRAGPFGLTKLVSSALESASLVVAGLSAWACAADLTSEDRRDGVAALAGVHGVSARALERWRTLGAVVRTSTAIAAPAVGVVLLGAITSGALVWAVVLSLAALSYGLLLASSLVPLARLAALVGKGYGKALLAACVGVPELLRLAGAHVPSWSSVFGSLLHELEWLGRTFA
jgi:hypothetical protein